MAYGFNPQVPSYRNAVVNGDMSIAQIGNPTGAQTFNLSAVAYYSTDMFGVFESNAGVPTGTDEQYADHPLLGAQGFCKRVVMTVPLTIGATSEFAIMTHIEGNNWRQFFSRFAIVSFWAWSSVPGSYTFTLANGTGFANDVSYSSVFQINNASTWEYKTLGIPVDYTNNPADWNYTTGTGARVMFGLAAGANKRNTTLNQWTSVAAAASRLFSTAQTNFGTVAGDEFRVTDVQIEQGLAGTPFERLDFTNQLERCLRYYWQTFPYGTRPVSNVGSTVGALQYRAWAAGVSNSGVFVRHPVPMRTTPTATFYNPNAAGATWRNGALGANSGAASLGSVNGPDSTYVNNAQVAGDAVSNAIAIHATFSATMS